ncbi:MAG: molybdopterin-dependent oxidoreductase [Acidobacteriia bacterium]|nr:molybdopterin-dependent oxidoreductase [Terriglobia bacterium]
MKEIANVSRRGFLQGMLSAGAFVLSVQVFPETLVAAATAGGDALSGAAFQSGVYLAIESDGTVHIIAHRSEMGNGSKTALPRVLADELEADWKRVKLEQAIGDEKYGSQDTDGSHSVRDFYEPMRQAGATARLMLVRAAAQKWNLPEKECKAELHAVVHAASGKKLGYGELAAAAAKLPVPKKEELQFKPKSAWRYIGKEAKSYDIADLVSGKAIYGQDARIAGMLYAAVAHPPVLGGKVKSLDDQETLRVAGVKQTLAIDPFKPPHGFQALGGVAVLADSTWAAFQGRKKLKIEWEHGAHSVFNSEAYKKELLETAKKPGKVFRNIGDVDAAFAKGGKVVEAEYYAPLLAHAPMEPPAAVAEYRDGKVAVWACTQNPQGVQEAIAGTLGLKKEDVTCHVTLLGGAFGRKSFPDFAVEAAVLSKKAGRPVKVVWSREDDIKFDSYHSVAAMYMKATLGSDGKPEAWLQRTVFPPINSTFVPGAVNSEPFEMSLGFTDVPFALANHRVENGAALAHVRIGWLRSVAHVYHAFAIHSFVDELAHAAGQDPLAYVLALLGPARIMDRKELPDDYPNQAADYKAYPIDIGRMRHVLELAAEKAGWGKKLPKGHGMGLAVHRSFLTYVATVIHAEVTSGGKVIIHRVDSAVDAGLVVNPEMVRQQFEGAAVFATSLARNGEITATNGVIDQSNFGDYPVARISEAPRETHVHIVENDAPPAGIGEPGVPPFAPALYNAIFAATGKRIRELPLTRAQLA